VHIGKITTFLLLNVCRVRSIRQIEKHASELSVSDPRPLEVEIDTAKLKNNKSTDSMRSTNSFILPAVRSTA
jgi:hypothetical protein